MKKVFIGAGVILVLFIIALQFIPLGIEPLTEVYFEDHINLPSSGVAGEVQNFSFTVNNLEHQKMRYNYSVDLYMEDGVYLKTFDKGDFILEYNESMTLHEEFIINNYLGREKVVINVTKDLSLENPDFKNKLWWPDPNYPMNIDIHFWIEESQD